MESIDKKSTEEIEYGGIFGQTADDVIDQEDGFGGSIDPDYYRPRITHEKAKNREYKGRGRFVPNVRNRNSQKIMKWVYCLPDPDSNGGEGKFYVDCPSNDKGNQNSRSNILTTAFFTLKDHENINYVTMAKRTFSRKQYWWMLYLIIKDEQEPDLENMVRILRFGKQINEMVEFEAKVDESQNKMRSVIVSDPFKGKDLMLNVCEVATDDGGKMTSYKKSKFDDISPISLDGGKTYLENTKENMKLIYDFLMEKSPDLSKAAYKPWTEEEEDKIIRTVQIQIDDNDLFNQIYKKSYKKSFFNGVASEKSETSTSTKTNTKSDSAINKTSKKNESIAGANAVVEHEKVDLNAVKSQVIEQEPEQSIETNSIQEEDIQINISFSEED